MGLSKEACYGSDRLGLFDCRAEPSGGGGPSRELPGQALRSGYGSGRGCMVSLGAIVVMGRAVSGPAAILRRGNGFDYRQRGGHDFQLGFGGGQCVLHVSQCTTHLGASQVCGTLFFGSLLFERLDDGRIGQNHVESLGLCDLFCFPVRRFVPWDHVFVETKQQFGHVDDIGVELL